MCFALVMQTGMLAMPDLLGAGFGELEVTVHRETERGTPPSAPEESGCNLTIQNKSGFPTGSQLQNGTHCPPFCSQSPSQEKTDVSNAISPSLDQMSSGDLFQMNPFYDSVISKKTKRASVIAFPTLMDLFGVYFFPHRASKAMLAGVWEHRSGRSNSRMPCWSGTCELNTGMILRSSLHGKTK